MRTLNVKLTAVVLVVVIVLAGGTHLLHSYQLQRKSSLFKTQAEAAWNDAPKRYSDAVSMMKVYLRLVPQDYDAREKLGTWYIESGRLGAAYTTLEELVRALERQDPKDDATIETIQRVRRRLIDAFMAQGQFLDAVHHLTELKRDLPTDVGVLTRLGKCYISLGQEKEALANFSEAIAVRPERFDIYYDKAMALLFSPEGKKQAEAEKCMAEMIAYWEKDPATKDKDKSAEAHHVYGLWLDELGKHDEALKQAEATLKLAEKQPGGPELTGKAEARRKDLEAG